MSVRKGQDSVDIFAPVVISDAGIFNTYERLLPAEARALPGAASAPGPPGYGVNPALSPGGKPIHQLTLQTPRRSCAKPSKASPGPLPSSRGFHSA